MQFIFSSDLKHEIHTWCHKVVIYIDYSSSLWRSSKGHISVYDMLCQMDYWNKVLQCNPVPSDWLTSGPTQDGQHLLRTNRMVLPNHCWLDCRIPHRMNGANNVRWSSGKHCWNCAVCFCLCIDQVFHFTERGNYMILESGIHVICLDW